MSGSLSAPVPSSPPRIRWQVLALLFLVAMVNYADRSAFSAIFPLLRKQLGMSDTALGAIGSVFLWVYGLLSPFAGMAGDRFSRRRVVIASLSAWSVVTVLTGVAASEGQLLLARAFLGLSEALYLPAAIALIGEHFTAALRARALAIHIMGMQLGVVVGGYTAGALADRFGWRASLYALGGAGILLAVLCRAGLRDGSGTEAGAPQRSTVSWLSDLRELLRIPSFYILAADAMLISISAWVFTYWLPSFFHATFHMTLAQAGLYGTVGIAAGGWLGTIFGGWISDRVGTRFGARQRMLVPVVAYVLSIPLRLAFLWCHTADGLLLTVFGIGISQAISTPNTYALLFEVTKPRVWATAVALFNVTNCLMAGAGVFAAGYFNGDFGLRKVFACTAGLVLVSASLLTVGYFFFLRADLQNDATTGQRSACDPEAAPGTIS